MSKETVKLDKTAQGTNKNTKKFLSGDIEGDVIMFADNPSKAVPKKYFYDIRMLRVQGENATKELEDGKTLEIVEFIIGDNVGKTLVRIS